MASRADIAKTAAFTKHVTLTLMLKESKLRHHKSKNMLYRFVVVAHCFGLL